MASLPDAGAVADGQPGDRLAAPGRYRVREPVILEAIQRTADNEEALRAFAGTWAIGWADLPPGWWVAKGITGSFFLVGPEEFAATYEPAGERAPGTGVTLHPPGGSSRKMGRDWARLVPGLQGRLVSSGGLGDEAFAWVDTRPEPVPGQEAAGQLAFPDGPMERVPEAGAGVAMIRAKRLRQVAIEGYDACHGDGDLTRAAVAYATAAAGATGEHATGWWPWDRASFKPGPKPLDSLVKAGALIAAEIDRIIAEEGRRGR